MKNLNIDKISRIALLLIKKRASTISTVEELELSAWINSNQENSDLYQRLSNDAHLADDLLNMEKVDVEYRVKKILTKISSKTNNRYIGVYKLVAAACIAGAIFIGGYTLFISRSDDAKKNASNVANNIVPGKNGAVLTLDNGQTIVLDSIKKDGVIAIQGNVQIVKRGNQLIYLDKTTGAPAVVYNTISTPKGRQFHFSLQDGTQVSLNAGSSISFPTTFISGNERRVKLSGEAYFHVAKSKDNTSMPFIISGNQNEKWSITVLGTQFNVNAYNPNDNVQTSLMEGSVKITSQNTTQSNSAILKPGEQANMNNSGKISVQKIANMEEILAWKNGKFIFHDAQLSSILPVIARWYDVDVIYETNVTENYTINISRSLPLNELLSFIEKTGGVHFEIKDNSIIVKK